MKLWTVREARAQFASLLTAARDEGPQKIRQSGQPDVTVSREAPQAPISYLVSGRARCDAMDIVLAQYRQRKEGGPAERLVATKHIPPNLSGDVLEWVLREKGAFEVASYVSTSLETMRESQELLDLPLSTASQVITGLWLTAAHTQVFTPESIGWIEKLIASTWGDEAKSVLGADWADRVDQVLQRGKHAR